MPSRRTGLPLLALAAALAGCGDSTDPSPVDAAAAADAAGGDDGALPPTFATPVAPAFTSAAGGARTIRVSISGEDLGQFGFDYSAAPTAGAIVFVDGWEVRFARILVTVANLR